MTTETTQTIERKHFSQGAWASPSHDNLAVEEPLEIRLNGQPLSVTMRTPGHDFELVRGFLFTEQIISHSEEILNMESSGNVVAVSVPDKILKEKCWVRNFYASSSCGVCGKASIDQLAIKRPIVKSTFQVAMNDFLLLPQKMRSAQVTFEKTGGLHAAALFNRQADILSLREDVGRHNAVDKVIGWFLTSSLTANDVGLFVSGRTSFEILQKAIAAGISLVGAVSAPSSLAVKLAAEFQVSLAGFVRNDSLNLYVDHGRIRS